VCVTAAPGTEPDASADAPVDPTWGCLNSTPPALPAQDDSRTLRIEAKLVELFTNAPVVGMDLRLCRGLDVLCQSPLGKTATNDAGVYGFDVPFAFRGFVDGTPPDGSTLMPIISPFMRPPTQEHRLADDTPYSVPSQATLESLLAIIGRQVAPSSGHVFGLALDCAGKPAVGVVLTSRNTTAESVGYYLDDSRLPNTTQGATSSQGEVGYVNLPPGPVTFTYAKVDGTPIGTATVLVRAGTVTYADFSPNATSNP